MCPVPLKSLIRIALIAFLSCIPTYAADSSDDNSDDDSLDDLTILTAKTKLSHSLILCRKN